MTCGWTTYLATGASKMKEYNCVATFDSTGRMLDIKVIGQSFNALPKSVRTELQNDAAAQWQLWKTERCKMRVAEIAEEEE